MDKRISQTTIPVILIVDDDPAQRLMLEETLSQAGMSVKQAENGAEAVTLFKKFLPDMVLMDIKMPVMDGFQACSSIRQLTEGKDVPIVLITGLDDHDSIQQAFDVDATDFITKPVNWPILNHRVRYLLKASAAFTALRVSESRLSEAQRIASMGNWEWDVENNNIHWSPQVYKIFDIKPQSFGVTFEAFINSVHPEDKEKVNQAIVNSINEPYDIEHRIILPNGSIRYIHDQAEVIISSKGKPLRMLGVVQDITNRKLAEQQIKQLAFFDSLTGLPNRVHFKQIGIRTLSRAKSEGNKVALMFIDLDEFKRINDTLGHDSGDELLKSIAVRLSTGLRVTDCVAKVNSLDPSSLSRLGGDEFTILLDSFASSDQVARVARRMLDELNQAITIRDQELFISGSMGISIYPDDGSDIDTLLQHADIAMYQAKKRNRNDFRFYSSEMNKSSKERLGLETKLRKALERNELILHYQPQVCATTGKVHGMEALLRWQDPQFGLLPPGLFIPIAEESGLILPIGEWVLETACNQAISWQKAGLNPIKMSVNLSSHQFHQQNFIPNLRKILHRSGLDPQYLELEMTESVIMQQLDKTITDLNRLKQLGLTLSIDDFGTGYSSMSYLKRFPLDTLKIDKSFVDDISTDSSDAAIVKAIITLAKSLDLTTIAEGVETIDQLSFLQQQGCDLIQGYYFSRPLAMKEAGKYLNDHQSPLAVSTGHEFYRNLQSEA